MGSRILHLRLAPGVGAGSGPSPAAVADRCNRLTPAWRLAADGLYLDLTGTGRLLGRGLDGAARACRFPPPAWPPARWAPAWPPRSPWALGGGIFAVPAAAEAAFLTRFPIACLPTPSAETERLLRLGVRTLGDLQAVPRALLLAVFGPRGLELADQAGGLGPGFVVAADRPGTGAVLVVGARWHRPLTSPAALAALRRAVAVRALRQGPRRGRPAGRNHPAGRRRCERRPGHGQRGTPVGSGHPLVRPRRGRGSPGTGFG